MKNKIILPIMLAVIFVFTACEKILDRETLQQIPGDVALSNDDNVKGLLVGTYSLMNDQNLFGGITLTVSELFATDGELTFVGTYSGLRQISNRTVNSSNENARDTWMTAYKAINNANLVLHALNVVEEADRDVVEGEARFLRALIYFELVKFYSYSAYDVDATQNSQLGVPLVLTPTLTLEDAQRKPQRATVDQVYNQIVNDLTIAANLLPQQNSYYATWGAATALLARVHLQMGKYAEARDYADEVIQSGLYNLQVDYDRVFNNDNNTSEDIFANQFSTQTRFSAMTEYWTLPQYGGRDGDIIVEQAHLDLYDPFDARLALFFYDEDYGSWFTGKWNNQYGVVHILRLAEMYLIRAEANFRLGTSIGDSPLNDINYICRRAKLGTVDNPYYATLTLDDILLQRRLELACEGHRLHDVKRLKESVGVLPWNDPRLTYPIPFREIQAYLPEVLPQNPGY